jgi:hypothetical protein
MRRLISTITLSIFGLLAILGFQPKMTQAQIHHQSIKNISATTPLYLMHSNQINSDITNMTAWHSSHVSHASHASHASHSSGW